MNKYTIREEIAALINSIKEHSDNIGDKVHIPQLELELILHKIEKLYQKSIVFNHLNSVPVLAEKPVTKVKAEVPIIEKVLIEPPKAELKPEPLKQFENTEKPIDLFGVELPPVVEKTKVERKIEKKEEKPVVNKLQKPAIDDINKAIGFNDKFLFANELFAGNMQEFSIAIQQLNNAGSLESAMDYLSNLQQLYEWDIEKETVKRLFDLVDRRYS
jgi:hypothetical protein